MKLSSGYPLDGFILKKIIFGGGFRENFKESSPGNKYTIIGLLDIAISENTNYKDYPDILIEFITKSSYMMIAVY